MLCCAGEVGGPAHGRQRGKPQAGPGPCQEEARRSKGTLKIFNCINLYVRVNNVLSSTVF